jgi:hypothetical protein
MEENGRMKRLILSMAVLAAALCVADGETDATDGITARPSSVARVWQVALEPDDPIVYVWPSDATAATLTVVSYAGRTKTSMYEIAREDGADTGSFSLPAVVGEALFDLSIEFRKDAKVLETLSARVAILPEKIDVLVEGSDAWKTVKDRSPRPVAYDTAWTDPVASSAAMALSYGSQTVDVSLAGESGFEPLDLANRMEGDGEFSVSLSYGSAEETFYEATLRRTLTGLSFTIR